MNCTIDSMTESDWPQVRAIYLAGIRTGQATFETEVPPWEVWDAAHLRDGRLVARSGEEVLGWAVLSSVSARRVYAGVAELSVYVGESSRGQGVGRRLLAALIARSEQMGIWTLQAGVFPENEASLALHEKAGFRTVGRRERIGKLHGRWRDVVLLERRSKIVGRDEEPSP